ncbi:maleylpyruvate isomerase N-terminal domain-containing protein [Micromonospora mirobrigensis]|uniref:Mycothiol maleylpyruvate isomerase N-terminal domain-containing protein n=1 Tax=Micromonospora mirobrigensis TaxID=262898 RepID=A0A1C4V950_9ACTN|nr:maleylpyruvate isomerase N-terminal domain-containing protein [Micromonospora mirobrigensis]SCE80289.1 Mycothiol maleylpyruvate isomerase N-terminal domain-containing protein [Micromonospora mirobrigensis]
MTVTTDDLDAALSSVVACLRPATDRDWSVPAGDLEWDCWHTAEHVGDCLLSFAGQLIARPEQRFVRFMGTADRDATPAEVLEFAEVGGRLLAATVRASGPEVRAYHPAGLADPEGFAAMGCVEALVHGDDIARGLGLTLDPPRDVCARALARLHPEQARELAGEEPWAALRWATGRIDLPGRPRLAQWRWHGAPLPG